MWDARPKNRVANSSDIPALTSPPTATMNRKSVAPSTGGSPIFQTMPYPWAKCCAYCINIAASSIGCISKLTYRIANNKANSNKSNIAIRSTIWGPYRAFQNLVNDLILYTVREKYTKRSKIKTQPFKYNNNDFAIYPSPLATRNPRLSRRYAWHLRRARFGQDTHALGPRRANHLQRRARDRPGSADRHAGQLGGGQFLGAHRRVHSGARPHPSARLSRPHAARAGARHRPRESAAGRPRQEIFHRGRNRFLVHDRRRNPRLGPDTSRLPRSIHLPRARRLSDTQSPRQGLARTGRVNRLELHSLRQRQTTHAR